MSFFTRIFKHPAFIKITHWEFWSFGAVYSWVYPVWGWCCLRNRSLFFFNASNPLIRNGGLLNESKSAIAKLIPISLQPKTLFYTLPANPTQILKDMEAHQLNFPVMGKPDVGGRGRGVKKIHNSDELAFYATHSSMDFHIQEFISYEKELGVFYYRYPGVEKGAISGIVRKEFLTVTGDGQSTLQQLLTKDWRAMMYLDQCKRMHAAILHNVLPEGKRFIVSPYGNHARGALFLDDSHLIDDQLTDTIDRICKQIPEFYFGRLDIRFDNWDDLRAGKNFLIIEVNGAGAEPTHMYDPKHSLFFAWKEIVRHWLIMSKISRLNHKRGVPYLSFKEGMEVFKEDKMWAEKLGRMPV